MRYWNAFLRVKERKPRSEIFASKKTGNGFFCSLDFVIMLSLFLLALDSAAIVEGFFIDFILIWIIMQFIQFIKSVHL